MIRLRHSTMLALASGKITAAEAFGQATSGAPRDIAAEWAQEREAMLASTAETIRALAEAHCRAIEGRSDIKPCELAARRRKLLDAWRRAKGPTA